jgi:hypothetical protein
MKVRATRLGFTDYARRREGDVFSIPDKPTRALTAREQQRPELMAAAKKVEVKGKPDEYHVPATFGTWMEVVPARTPERVSTSQQEINRKHDEKIEQMVGGSGGSTGEQEVI